MTIYRLQLEIVKSYTKQSLHSLKRILRRIGLFFNVCAIHYKILNSIFVNSLLYQRKFKEYGYISFCVLKHTFKVKVELVEEEHLMVGLGLEKLVVLKNKPAPVNECVFHDDVS
jgi:hypothetical protein